MVERDGVVLSKTGGGCPGITGDRGSGRSSSLGPLYPGSRAGTRDAGPRVRGEGGEGGEGVPRWGNGIIEVCHVRDRGRSPSVHFLLPSLPHARAPSLPHSLTPSLPHSRTTQ